MAIIPNTNVNLATNVRDVLNSAGGSVSNALTSFFSASAKINKWAKFKPESYAKDFDLTEDDRMKNDYGFDSRSIGYGASVSELFTNAIAGTTWVYVLPSGGSSSPYRLGDFRKYNPTAQPPYDYHHISNVLESTSSSYSYDMRVLVNSTAELRVEDFGSYSNINSSGLYYFWIARKANGSSFDYIRSSYISASNLPSDIICNLVFPKPGVWQCLFFVGKNDSSTDSTYLSARTDCLVLPQGLKNITFDQKVLYVHATMTSPSSLDGYASYNDGILNFGTTNFTFSLVVSDTSQSVASTVFNFGFKVYLRNSYGQMGPYAEITDTEDDISYSGSSAVSRTIVNFPQTINLYDYFGESNLASATQLEIRPVMNRVSGSTTAAYFDTDAVWYVDI